MPCDSRKRGIVIIPGFGLSLLVKINRHGHTGQSTVALHDGYNTQYFHVQYSILSGPLFLFFRRAFMHFIIMSSGISYSHDPAEYEAVVERKPPIGFSQCIRLGASMKTS